MSEQFTSHLQEHYLLGDAFSNKYGIQCFPATDKRTKMRFVAKVQTIPNSPSVTDAFLLSGAFANENDVYTYYQDLSKDLCRQAAILNALSILIQLIPQELLTRMDKGNALGGHVNGRSKQVHPN